MFPGCLNQTPFNISSLQWGQTLTYFSSFSGMSQSVAGQLSHLRWRQCFLPSSSSHCPTLPLKSSIPLTNSFSWSYTKSLHVLFEILLSWVAPWKGGSKQQVREAGAAVWEGGFFVEGGGEEIKGEQDLFPLALGSHPSCFITCVTPAFKQLLYILCLLFLLQLPARKGHLLFVDKEETHGPFRIISLIY